MLPGRAGGRGGKRARAGDTYTPISFAVKSVKSVNSPLSSGVFSFDASKFEVSNPSNRFTPCFRMFWISLQSSNRCEIHSSLPPWFFKENQLQYPVWFRAATALGPVQTSVHVWIRRRRDRALRARPSLYPVRRRTGERWLPCPSFFYLVYILLLLRAL